MIGRMSDLQRRQGSRPSRRQRTETAYRLVLATGGFAIVGIVTLIVRLASPGLPIIALALALICFLMLRRQLR